jgi:hypothetical protein
MLLVTPFRARKMAWLYFHQNEEDGNETSAPPSQNVWEEKMGIYEILTVKINSF